MPTAKNTRWISDVTWINEETGEGCFTVTKNSFKGNSIVNVTEIR
jgi:hypothetical protein